ncbi:hypothetical protein A2303_00710 [Candidatus Falkowbacteria bacterium RIFOXYB2_FULL_47_14]|uniref:YdbS-like PH domain-containing protein n=1 Tax=Candidatus Falkowbacteria bacterium RIFOXYA2_FULL_47_19 TaxID=1797994 RepID=A0A1F5SNH9_9BACT|nr:MAG: hypothetical protein A2227_05930 [Candidatus Falkowbacteria bacterium RIFOXYA2_FULL_47_19]OGF36202.1 MAG: hypothetical protein A2468_06480 [Candidatus Falkowbacteria bacterium RIFOXYC2_FULL_46_15]OGF42891.1 MAG: hypothetical protein A2303_00710 [Candidatus Falkowbacteria bacterium RIFOXYB2_FULL_47_14]
MLSLNYLPNKLPDESIVRVVRRDVFIIFKRVVIFAVLLVLPVGFFYLMISNDATALVGTVSLPLITLGTSAYYLFVWLFFFFSFVDYYLDSWIITNRRIIYIDQRGFFSRVVAEHKIFRIQDVTSETHGLIPTVLKFGDVHVQTAGTAEERFSFRQVPNPDHIRDIIIKLAQKNRSENPYHEI